MIDLILSAVPWLAMIAGIVFGVFRHKQAQTTQALAKQEVAEIKHQAAETRAAAAQSGATAVKERTDVENTIAAAPIGDSATRLRDSWTRD